MKGRKPQLVGDASALNASTKPPAWLSKHAKAEWRRVAPILIDRRILTDTDLTSLEHYCTATGQVREMQKIIACEGSVVMTERGLRAHPAVRIQADAMNRARLIGNELGLSPTSRNRPAIRTDQEDDDSASDLGV
ncbi:phage terminase small subunit P27 family [Bradyrhizobium sp. DOA1]|uniref:phage terminase small subunit P27 family n=1 Tax=Bradyrhizobium sp. DOA1 TaxID=1126616 RepID=UPI00077C71C1|nr:phage terminase small subunit P27 family [Bradyrhizobium sp. DOA1]KYH00125.1 terminase [Bradyrhizobium sp. DOA1]